jgi:hypothetical protein
MRVKNDEIWWTIRQLSETTCPAFATFMPLLLNP